MKRDWTKNIKMIVTSFEEFQGYSELRNSSFDGK